MVTTEHFWQIDVEFVDQQLEDDTEAMSLDSYIMAIESGERSTVVYC